MAVVATSISINQPVEKVFQYITDVQNQKSMNPTIHEVVLDGEMAVGTRYSVKMTVAGRAFQSEHEVVALEPNELFAVKTLANPPASPVTNTYRLESEGAGTRLALDMEAVVMPGTEGMVAPQLKAALDTSLASIKKALEG